MPLTCIRVDTSGVSRSWGVGALLALAVLVVGCSGRPDRVHVMGRDYDRGNVAPMSLAEVHQQTPSAVIVSHSKLIAGSSGLYAPTVIFVKDGGKYYEYALSGGP